MSRLTQKGATGPLNLFQTVSEAQSPTPFSNSTTFAGERFDASDGREFVLVQTGTSAIAAGLLVQSPAIVANHQGLTTVSYTAPTNNNQAQLVVTLGGTAATSNQYAGGFAVIDSGTGIGQTLKIQENNAQVSTTGNVTLTLEDTPFVALDTSSTVCLIPNPYVNVIINPTTATNTPIGVTLYALTASVANTTNSFGLIQSKGPTSALADGAIGVGLGISPATGSVPGAVSVAAATTARIGRALQAGVDTKARTVYIDL